MGAATIGQGIVGMIGAGKAASSARSRVKDSKLERDRLSGELEALEDGRQPIINPYANVTDTSGELSNPYENIGVATQAAEMQAEQADIALANTLDTLRATGAGAGGATALAQAALQSKKGISASIQMQEAANSKLVAKGAQRLQEQKMAEQQRLQNADVMGQTFQFSTKENRQVSEMNRAAGLLDNANQQHYNNQTAAAAAEANQYNAASNLIGGIGSVIGG